MVLGEEEREGKGDEKEGGGSGWWREGNPSPNLTLQINNQTFIPILNLR